VSFTFRTKFSRLKVTYTKKVLILRKFREDVLFISLST